MTWDDFDTEKLRQELIAQVTYTIEENLAAGESAPSAKGVSEVNKMNRNQIITLLKGYRVSPNDICIALT